MPDWERVPGWVPEKEREQVPAQGLEEESARVQGWEPVSVQESGRVLASVSAR